MSTHLRKAFKSPFPALNVHRQDEPVATDTVFSDTPAIDSGAKAAQLFVGLLSLFTNVVGLLCDSDFPKAFMDQIRKRGAPTKLISDRAQVEIGQKVLEIL